MIEHMNDQEKKQAQTCVCINMLSQIHLHTTKWAFEYIKKCLQYIRNLYHCLFHAWMVLYYERFNILIIHCIRKSKGKCQYHITELLEPNTLRKHGTCSLSSFYLLFGGWYCKILKSPLVSALHSPSLRF